jgi:hypothetical protein
MRGRKTEKNTAGSKYRRPGMKKTAKKQSRTTTAPMVGPPRARNDVLLRILVIVALFAIAFYGINADWLRMRNIEVKGGIRLSEGEIIDLAALRDFQDVWTIFIPGDTICSALISHPLIEHAEIKMTNPWTIQISVSERRPIAAIENNGYRITFDQTGELVEILNPDHISELPLVHGVPLGLLKFRGESLYKTNAAAWQLPVCGLETEALDMQFSRLIHLQRMLSRHDAGGSKILEAVTMDECGRLRVDFENCPPIYLGNFDNPDLQFRCMVAVLDNEEITDPERTLDIDLSSELYPCYHVRDEYLTISERRAIEEWEQEAEDSDSVETEDPDEGQDETSNDVRIDTGIFNLAG